MGRREEVWREDGGEERGKKTGRDIKVEKERGAEREKSGCEGEEESEEEEEGGARIFSSCVPLNYRERPSGCR